MELQYKELENKIRLIKLIGKLDIGEVRVVESEFIVHCAGSQVKVIVDISGITAITASGAQLILWTAKEVVSRGGTFVLVNPIPAVAQVLERSGMKEWAQTCPDVDSAIPLLLTEDVSQVHHP